MLPSNTDQDWEEFGKKDPYFAVITADQFHSDNLTEENKAEFFRTGEEVINHYFAMIRKTFRPGFTPQRAVDFGCGVGRMTIPLARRVNEVLGVDVSPSMLNEAAKNSAQSNLANIQFTRYHEPFDFLQGSFDLIVSNIVFQHIPVKRGQSIFTYLLEHLAPGGVGVVHFAYAHNRTGLRQWGYWLKVNVPLVQPLTNLFSRRPLNTPLMQMNDYPLNWLFRQLQQQRIRAIHCEFTDHGGILGVVLYFMKP